MDYDKEGICSRIYEARTSKNISQVNAGEILGIKQSAYSDLENGKRDITLRELFILADAFDVSVKWIIGIREDDFNIKEQKMLDLFKEFLLYLRKK